jgi:hypothetical protein
MKKIISIDMILSKIYYIRGHKVMLDKDLAGLYGVESKALKQAVNRNKTRFPEDFMFKLSLSEFNSLRSQIVTSKRGGTRYLPMAFTEQGVAMLSSVLKSEKAIHVNIQIIRAFTYISKMISSHKDLSDKIEAMEKKYDGQFRAVFQAIKELIRDDSIPRIKIGFDVKE